MNRISWPIACLTILFCVAAVALGEDRAIYQPAGAPADPKVEARWNHYHDYAAVTALLKSLAEAHPERCRLQSLGQSYGKRDMWLLTISNLEKGKELEKPAFWIDGAIHANEIQATEVTLYTAWYLLEMYGRHEYITRLVDERVFYLVPMMSPDSRDGHMHEPNTTHSPRSGIRPVDDDRDGLTDEDKADDLDGDGHITQMRIRDPHGRWKPHPDFPALLIPVRNDEVGSYRLLGDEGIDNDGDGRVNEDGVGFYDPNRDWPWNWQPDHIQNGAYRYPFSILENRMVADFVMAHPNIAGAQTYHNSGGMILRGPGARTDKLEPADLALLDEMGRKGETILPGYRYLEIAKDLYEVFGGEIDFFYYFHGTICFSNELFTPFNFNRQKVEGGFFGKPELRHEFDRYLLLGDGFVPWHKVDHPQYGKIEVGGFKKDWSRQPPSFLLEEECHRNMAFTLYHADQMPQVDIESIKTEQLAGNLTSVTATIVNRKLTPTRTAIDVKHKITPRDRVMLSGKDVAVAAALISDTPLFDKPREQKLKPETVQLDTIGGLGAVYIRWIVQGKGPFEVTARTTKGGVATKKAQ